MKKKLIYVSLVCLCLFLCLCSCFCSCLMSLRVGHETRIVSAEYVDKTHFILNFDSAIYKRDLENGIVVENTNDEYAILPIVSVTSKDIPSKRYTITLKSDSNIRTGDTILIVGHQDFMNGFATYKVE